MERKKEIRHFRDLEVYQKAFQMAMKIFEITKGFPVEERYSLYERIISMLNSMEKNGEKFCFPTS